MQSLVIRVNALFLVDGVDSLLTPTIVYKTNRSTFFVLSGAFRTEKHRHMQSFYFNTVRRIM